MCYFAKAKMLYRLKSTWETNQVSAYAKPSARTRCNAHRRYVCIKNAKCRGGS